MRRYFNDDSDDGFKVALEALLQVKHEMESTVALSAGIKNCNGGVNGKRFAAVPCLVLPMIPRGKSQATKGKRRPFDDCCVQEEGSGAMNQNIWDGRFVSSRSIKMICLLCRGQKGTKMLGCRKQQSI